MTLDQERMVQQSPGFRMETLEGEVILLRPADGKIVQCNGTAGAVWSLCDGTRSTHEIATLFAEAYPEAGSDVAAEVTEILATFLAADVIQLL